MVDVHHPTRGVQRDLELLLSLGEVSHVLQQLGVALDHMLMLLLGLLDHLIPLRDLGDEVLDEALLA